MVTWSQFTMVFLFFCFFARNWFLLPVFSQKNPHPLCRQWICLMTMTLLYDYCVHLTTTAKKGHKIRFGHVVTCLMTAWLTIIILDTIMAVSQWLPMRVHLHARPSDPGPPTQPKRTCPPAPLFCLIRKNQKAPLEIWKASPPLNSRRRFSSPLIRALFSCKSIRLEVRWLREKQPPPSRKRWEWHTSFAFHP